MTRQPGDPQFDGAEELDRSYMPVVPSEEDARQPDDDDLCLRLRRIGDYPSGRMQLDAADRIAALNAEVAEQAKIIEYLQLFDHETPLKQERDLRIAAEAEIVRLKDALHAALLPRFNDEVAVDCPIGSQCLHVGNCLRKCSLAAQAGERKT